MSEVPRSGEVAPVDDGGPDRRGLAGPVIGRDTDLEVIGSFMDRAAAGGGALLVSGDAGVGKTLLLETAAARAVAAGTRVLRAVGAEFEADLSFAGLNQVLHPLFAELRRLDSAYGQALAVALGLDEGPPSSQLLVANAALALLRQAAAAAPVLVIVDDLQWLDRASAAVLAFVARRLGGSRVGVLAASRSGEEGFFERSGLPGHDLRPLGHAAAGRPAARPVSRVGATSPRAAAGRGGG
jgi:predicted ATPase